MHPDSRRLVSLLPRPGDGRDEQVCVIAGARTLTGRQLRAAVATCAARLTAAGARRGQRVLAVLEHDERGVVLLAAASLLGLRLVLPYNLAAASAAEWRDVVDATDPDLVVTLRAGDGAAPAPAGRRVLRLDAEPGDSADPGPLPVDEHPPAEELLVLFTSGSTGRPKAISVSEELVTRRVRSVARALSFTPDSRVLLSGLLTNTTGVLFAFGALGTGRGGRGATLVVPPDRDVATWPALVADQRVTHLMLRPVALRRFLDGAAGHDLGSLRVVAHGAAAMPPALLAAARARLPCDWVQGYGLSETYGPFCWVDAAAHRAGRHRTGRQHGGYCVGRPDPTAEVRIEALPGHPPGVGEVLVRTALMNGYLDPATGTPEPPGEWLRTGDVGGWSPDGDLLLTGRRSGSLLSADGHRVYPEEVEAVLGEVPGVDDAVLVAAAPPGADPADPLARVPVACLSGPLGAAPADAVRAAVSRALRGVLSREKWPDLVWATEAPLPRGANEKVLRTAVATRVPRSGLVELERT